MLLIVYVPGAALSADATLFSPNVLNSCVLPLGTPTHPHIVPLILQRFFLPPPLPAERGRALPALFCFPAAEPSRPDLFLLPGLTFGFDGLRAFRRRSLPSQSLPRAEGNPNCLVNGYQMDRSRPLAP